MSEAPGLQDLPRARPIINMLWVNRALPWYAKAAIKSFLHYGHDVHLYTYETGLAAPLGCQVFDANDIVPASEIFTYKDGIFSGYLSGFANWFRYELLYQKGGWWCDTDMICLAPFIADQEYLFASEWQTGGVWLSNNNVIFVRERHDKVMAECSRYCWQKKSAIEHAETGPHLLRSLVERHGLQKFIVAPRAFNPIHYGDILLILKHPAILSFYAATRRLRRLRPIYTSNSRAVHLYSSVFDHRTGLTDWSSVPKSSYLWQLLDRNGAMP